jgi:hypothetical protein
MMNTIIFWRAMALRSADLGSLLLTSHGADDDDDDDTKEKNNSIGNYCVVSISLTKIKCILASNNSI